MITYESVSDSLLAGCAVAPAVALYADAPALALFSHVVLLMLGLLFAAGDRESPFRVCHRSRSDKR